MGIPILLLDPNEKVICRISNSGESPKPPRKKRKEFSKEEKLERHREANKQYRAREKQKKAAYMQSPAGKAELQAKKENSARKRKISQARYLEKNKGRLKTERRRRREEAAARKMTDAYYFGEEPLFVPKFSYADLITMAKDAKFKKL